MLLVGFHVLDPYGTAALVVISIIRLYRTGEGSGGQKANVL